MKTFRVLLLLLLTVLLLPVRVASADEPTAETVTEIYSAEDMLKIPANPNGSYRLMCDLDLSGIEWPSFAFYGTFDGNGHMIINLNCPKVSEETRVTYDGNRKTYDTHFAGLFAILDHATLKNVRLLGLSLFHTVECDCFLGGIAGYATDSTIEGCEITGTIRLDVKGKMFGVGGIIGYGNAVIRNCHADVTLVNIDLDATTKDEEFLGGVCAAGYPDIEGCEIKLAGFLSDHGFVHSGGLVGMYIVYPKKFDRNGFIKNTVLNGFITFFEDNTNRRAYCKEDCGEVMDWECHTSGNKFSFKRDERKTYDVNLMPHGDCKNPDMSESTVAPQCQTPGYTLHVCHTCGYTYSDNYVLPIHTLSETYETLTASTVEAEGLGEFTCTECGAKVRKAIPALTPTPTPAPEPTATPTVAPSSDKTDKQKDDSSSGSILPYLLPVIIGVPLGAIAAFAYRAYRKKQIRKKRAAQARRNRAKQNREQ